VKVLLLAVVEYFLLYYVLDHLNVLTAHITN
jgi:hypothetical protein